jgi:hypothetical protein
MATAIANYTTRRGVIVVESTNHADYSQDLDHIEELLTILLNLQEWMEENPVRHPFAIRAYSTVLVGLIPSIVDEDGNRYTAASPCGGLLDALEMIDESVEVLDLEVKYEAPSYKYPPDYSI